MDAARDGAPHVADRRIAAWLAALCCVLYLGLQHGHFKGSDEIAIFEMTQALAERGDLAVPPLRHTEVGRDGRRYSYFAPGQAVLALPLYALAAPLDALLPASWTRGLAGPPNRRGVHRYGGEIEIRLVGLLAPLATSVLVALFYVFERRLGVSRTTALGVALALAVSTHTAVMSVYLLRHSTEALGLLGAFYAFHRYAHGAGPGALLAGAALASATFLVRVPAAIAAPALAGYLAWALHRRGALRDRGGALALAIACLTVPLVLALAAHAAVNQLKWGAWLSSPMVEQQSRFQTPILRGLWGLVASPGSSVLVYSPLLLLAPFAVRATWRRWRAETLLVLAWALTFVLFYARFDGWSGLWSAPGPRYLFLLVPILLLGLGLWLDEPPRRPRWAAVAVLGLIGLWVQLVSIFVRWGSVPSLAGWPALDPDGADFLFVVASSPVVVMSKLLLAGGPFDSWFVDLFRGWPGQGGQPVLVAILLGLWVLALAACALGLVRAARAPRTGAVA